MPDEIDISQTILMEKFKLYLEQRGRDVTLSEGYCHGLSALWLHFMAENRGDEFTELLRRVAAWEPDPDDTSENTDFEKLFAHVAWLQESTEYADVDIPYQTSILALETISNQSYVLDGTLENPGQISLIISTNEIKPLLEQYIKPNKLIFLLFEEHTTALYYKNGLYHYYDSNPESGATTYHSIDTLLFAIRDSLLNIGVMSFDEKGVAPTGIGLSIKVFRKPLQTKNVFPIQEMLVKTLVTNHGVDYKTADGTTSLISAIFHGDQQLANLLLTHGANPNLRDEQFDFPPLHLAASNWQLVDTTELLLMKGAELYARMSNGDTPIDILILDNNLPAIRMLIAKFARQLDSDTKLRFLHHLLELSDPKHPRYEHHLSEEDPKNALSIERLLKHPSELSLASQPSVEQFKLLRKAIIAGNTLAVTALLQNRCNPNSESEAQQTPLMIAAKFHNSSIIRLLLNKHADVDATDIEDSTALHYAIEAGWAEGAFMLLKQGADWEHADKQETTPAMLAAESENKDMQSLYQYQQIIAMGDTVNDKISMLLASQLATQYDMSEKLQKKHDTRSLFWINAISDEEKIMRELSKRPDMSIDDIRTLIQPLNKTDSPTELLYQFIDAVVLNKAAGPQATLTS